MESKLPRCPQCGEDQLMPGMYHRAEPMQLSCTRCGWRGLFADTKGDPVKPHRTLPLWLESMSDGCSIPSELRDVVDVTPAMTRACVRHDEAYYYGGTAADRYRADLIWAASLLASGVGVVQVEWWFAIVRGCGGPEFKQPYSWSFGGAVYAYTDHPAEPEH